MPAVTWAVPNKDVLINKTFATPKKVTLVYKGWYKAAKAAVKELPQVMELGGGQDPVWQRSGEPEISMDYIKWLFVDNAGNKGYVVIARKVSVIGRT